MNRSRKNLRQSVSYDQALVLARQKSFDTEQVRAKLERASKQGDARAMYAIATWYLHGAHKTKVDLKTAIRLLRRAANANVSDALFDLAVATETGIGGIEINLRKAFVLYLRAALAGDSEAMSEVGRCYYHGIGVDRDREIARPWLERGKSRDERVGQRSKKPHQGSRSLKSASAVRKTK